MIHYIYNVYFQHQEDTMEQQIIANGGLQYIPQIAVQYVYLDFDGELTSYNGEILSVDNVEVKDSSLTEERIKNILAELNAKYAAQNVIFVTERPKNAEYSTIYIGKTSAFDQYGNFAGLAETIDEGNAIKNDNAFVMLDSASSDEQIISTIAHETGHLLGTLDHGGEGLAAYAAEGEVPADSLRVSETLSRATLTVFGTVCDTAVSAMGYLNVSSGGLASRTTVNPRGWFYLFDGGTALDTTVNRSAYMIVSSGGTISNTTVNSWGILYLSQGAVAFNTQLKKYSEMHVHSGAVASSTTLYHSATLQPGAVMNGVNLYCGQSVGNGAEMNDVRLGGHLDVLSGGAVSKVSVEGNSWLRVSNGGVVRNVTLGYDAWGNVYSGGSADTLLLSSGCYMYVRSGGTATNILFSSGGGLYLEVAPGTWAQGTYNGIPFEMKDGKLSDYILDDGHLIVSSGGALSNTTIISGGFAHLKGGGSAVNATVLSSGWLVVSSGARTIRVNIGDSGNLVVSNGGIANSTTVDSGGRLNGEDNAAVNMTTVSSGGSMKVSSGTVINSVIGHSGAEIIFSQVILKGNNTFGGRVTVSGGLTVSGAKVDFDVTQRKTTDGCIIYGGDRISGSMNCSVTVSGYMESGEYMLADCLPVSSMTIGDGRTFGSLTVGGDGIGQDGVIYSLVRRGNQVNLVVKSAGAEVTVVSNGIRWDSPVAAETYFIRYSPDGFETVLTVETEQKGLDAYGAAAEHQFSVSAGDGSWRKVRCSGAAALPEQKFVSDADGETDLFFSAPQGIWRSGFAAEHHGMQNGWDGTGETVFLAGKNKIAQVFSGSTDASILVLTDDACGDALFLEDIYTQFGSDAARLTRISEIRAGAGDDVIDMTSQRFTYTGDGVKVYGGSGNDTIWANNGSNILFGDAGSDCITGGSDDDKIIGGTGSDTLHGGGGDDIFIFGADWGNDTVGQLSDGTVTLWFEQGSESNWNIDTLTYDDGRNSVTVSGVTADRVQLYFGAGDSLLEGAFWRDGSDTIFAAPQQELA